MDSIAAFFLAGLAGARKEAEKHIADNKATVYQSKMSAQRDVNYAAARGFVRQGSKWCVSIERGSLHCYCNPLFL